jgi:hypothetical protein
VIVAAGLVMLTSACASSTGTPKSMPPEPIAPGVAPSDHGIIPVGVWWRSRNPGSSSCGIAAELRAHDRVLSLGDCAALLTLPAPLIRLRVGATVDVHILQEQSEHGDVPIFSLPQPSDHVLKMVGRSKDGATGEYRAVAAGLGRLISPNAECLATTAKEIKGCALVRIQVTAAG